MIVAGRVVTPDGVVRGCVRVDGERIAEVVPGDVDSDRWLLPGFVDIHTHGGGGHDLSTGDAAAARAAAAYHLRHGTTTMLASLVSAPPAALRAAVVAYLPLVADGTLAGVHLEGPYLSPARRGAHRGDFLRDPSRAELADLLAAGAGTVRMVTLAPEREGALDAIALLAARGVVAAVGHTDATYEQTAAAVAAGATVATHLCNAMRPVRHRDPGPVPALLTAPTVVCELIADGVHLHDGMLRLAATTAGPDRVALVTDAVAAAGAPDGEYELGGRPVVVSGGVARLARRDAGERPGEAGGLGPLAGSTTTMDAALRRVVAAGVPLVDAARMAATTPARAVGLRDRVGALLPGLRADLVELDADLRVRRVMRAGAWVG